MKNTETKGAPPGNSQTLLKTNVLLLAASMRKFKFSKASNMSKDWWRLLLCALRKILWRNRSASSNLLFIVITECLFFSCVFWKQCKHPFNPRYWPLRDHGLQGLGQRRLVRRWRRRHDRSIPPARL